MKLDWISAALTSVSTVPCHEPDIAKLELAMQHGGLHKRPTPFPREPLPRVDYHDIFEHAFSHHSDCLGNLRKTSV